MSRRLILPALVAAILLVATAVAIAAAAPQPQSRSHARAAAAVDGAAVVQSHYGIFRRAARGDDQPHGLAAGDTARRAAAGRFVFRNADEVCVSTVATPDVPGVTACSAATTADTQPPISILQGVAGTHVVGAVPDDVVSATFTDQDGRDATADVSDNTFALTLPARYAKGYLQRADGTRIVLPAAGN